MIIRHHWLPVLIMAIASCLIMLQPAAAAKKPDQPQLSEKGQQLAAAYAEQLETLSREVAAALPTIDPQKKQAFIDARATLSSLDKPGEDANPKARLAYEAAKTAAQADVLEATRALLGDLDAFYASDKLDAKLMRAAILRRGTPGGLAEFAQQSPQHKAHLDALFANDALMKRVLIAGGANGGEYGEAMQVYAAILDASERAREDGILNRLALGIALHQPWLPGTDKGGVYGPVLADNQTPDGQVARYLHYQAAYLAKELDPAFADMNDWECRFIANDPYTNEELAWTRAMLRTYRPDHITNEDYKWRYTRFVKSDVPYQTPKWDDSLGTKTQQIVCVGGKCGPRAFYGRTLTRAFGIPARRSTQTGHAAMSRWTPDGWTICFGAWWSMAWCGPQGGLDFLLDSQAREFEDDYMQVLRAQWIGDALGQEDVSLRRYGKGGGFWDGLAHFHKRVIVDDAKVQAAELAGGMKLGESDDLLGDEKIVEINIPEADKKITVDDDGTITVPAVACTRPTNNTDKVLFLPSWDTGMQLHYQRLGQRPEILRYNIQAPAAGEYELTAKVATVSTKQGVIFRINRRTLVNVTLPYTKGMWQESQPGKVELREGRNSIMVTFRAPNRGVSIKHFQFKPVKASD